MRLLFLIAFIGFSNADTSCALLPEGTPNWWDLSLVKQQGTLTASSADGNTFYFQFCGVVADCSPNICGCAPSNRTSVCQLGSTGLWYSSGYYGQQSLSIESLTTESEVVVLTYGGGKPCGNIERSTMIHCECDASVTASLSSVTETSCQYHVTLTSSACCPQNSPRPTVPPSTSTATSSPWTATTTASTATTATATTVTSAPRPPTPTPAPGSSSRQEEPSSFPYGWLVLAFFGGFVLALPLGFFANRLPFCKKKGDYRSLMNFEALDE